MAASASSYSLPVRRSILIAALAGALVGGVAGCGDDGSADRGATADQSALNQALPDPIPTRSSRQRAPVEPAAGQPAEEAPVEAGEAAPVDVAVKGSDDGVDLARERAGDLRGGSGSVSYALASGWLMNAPWPRDRS